MILLIDSFIPALHEVFSPCYNSGLRLPLTYCFALDYHLLTYYFFLLPSTSFMWVFFCVSLSHRLEFLRSWSASVQLDWQLHYPPCNHMQETYWMTILQRYFHRPNFSLYKLRIGATGFSFGFLNPEDETYRLSRNVGKKLPLLAAL